MSVKNSCQVKMAFKNGVFKEPQIEESQTKLVKAVVCKYNLPCNVKRYAMNATYRICTVVEI